MSFLSAADVEAQTSAWFARRRQFVLDVRRLERQTGVIVELDYVDAIKSVAGPYECVRNFQRELDSLSPG